MKLTKKLLSLLLVLTMVVGLLPAGALAVGVDSAGQIKRMEDGIVYADVSAENILSNEGTKNILTTADGKVTTTETITGTGTENVFKLDLGVTTKDVKETVSVTPDAAVVLVIDLSSSMNNCITCGMPKADDPVHQVRFLGQDLKVRKVTDKLGFPGYDVFEPSGDTGMAAMYCKNCNSMESRHTITIKGHPFEQCLTQAKESARAFVESYAGNADGAVRLVSIVTYADGDFGGNITNGWIDAAKNMDQVLNIIKGIAETGRDTVTANGMMWGKDALDQLSGIPAYKSITNKSLILLTDGQPSPYASEFGSAWASYLTDADRAVYMKKEYQAPIGFARWIQATGSTVFSICYGALMGSAEFSWLSHFSNVAYEAKDTSGLEEAFKAINDEIEIATKAGKVTIPLGTYISPVDADKLPTGVVYDAAANTLSWALGTAEADKDGLRHYDTSFQVKLDTAAAGFAEGSYYPTNLYTFLNYTVETSGIATTDIQTAAFRVPQVKGALPQADYTVNYYLKDRDGVAGTPTKESYTKSDKLGARVSAEIRTYDGYVLDASQETSIVLGKDAEQNVINLYYHMTPVAVTVEHYFTTTTIDKDGNETTDEAPRLVDTVNTWDKAYYKGDSFTATPKANSVTLTFDKAATGNANKYENVKLDGDVTIKLYYSELIDSRAPAKVTVNTYTYSIKWELKDGAYTTTSSDPVLYAVNGSISETMKHGQFFTPANRVDEMRTAGYTLDTKKSDKHEAVQLTGDKETALNYYYFNETDKPAETTVLVRHHYTTKTTLVSGESGVTVTVPDADGEAAARVAGYVGATYTATPDAGYGGEKWTLDTTRPLSKELTADAAANVIDVYYTRTVDGREKTTVTVNHYYQDWKNVIGDGGQLSQEPDGEAKLDTETIRDNVYVGGSYAANLKEKEGYSWDKDGDHSIAVLAETGNVINIYYNKKPLLPEESSSTGVIHEYRTYKKYVDESGVVHDTYTQVGESEYGPGETLTGSVGEWFNIATAKSFGGNEDYAVISPDGNPDTVRVTLNGVSDTFTITYARYVDELTATTVKVIPVYTSYEKQIVNGEEKLVQIGEPLIDESRAWTNTTALYVGQSFTADYTLAQFKRDNYTFSHDETVKENEYQNVKLSAKGDVIYLHFSNVDIPTDGRGQSAAIQVVHHYKFVDKYVDENGVYQEKLVRDETVNGAALEKYAGQTVAIASVAKPDGGCALTTPIPTDYTVTEADKGKTVMIDLYYYGETDQTEKATLTVVHHYSNLDQNGNELLPEDQRTLTVEVERDNGLHAGEDYTVSPEYKNIFALENITKRSFNSGDLAGFDVKLAKGENKVELYYAKTTDTRVKTTVTVIHQYAVLDANGDKRTSEGTVTDTFDSVEQGAWIDNDFRAALRYTSATNKLAEGEQAYQFENASFVRTNADETTSGPAALLVDETSEGKLLQSVKLDENKVVITVNYLRSIDTTPSNPGGGGDYYYHVTVAYKDMDGETLADSYRTDSIREGRDYNVSAQAAKAISGYVIDHVEGKTSGKLNGNVTVTVYYARESTIVDPVPPTTDKPDVTTPGGDLTDIPDVDVPTTALPVEPPVTDDTIIVDENVPMGNLPQTGFVGQNVNAAVTLGALALAASLAAAGLGVLHSRKREEEN